MPVHLRFGKVPFRTSDTPSEFEKDFEQFVWALTKARASQVILDKLAFERRALRSLEAVFTTGIKETLAAWIGTMSQRGGSAAELTVNDQHDFSVDIQHPLSKQPNLKLFKKVAAGASDGVEWAPLSEKTIEMKQEAAKKRGKAVSPMNAYRHFIDSGDLRGELLSKTRNMVKRTGVVKVMPRSGSFRARDDVGGGGGHPGRFVSASSVKKVHVDGITIRLYPNIPHNLLPGMKSGDWGQDSGLPSFEQALGLDRATVEKLKPAGEKAVPIRPMLQPIFTYYAMFKAPRVLANTLMSTLNQIKAGS